MKERTGETAAQRVQAVTCPRGLASPCGVRKVERQALRTGEGPAGPLSPYQPSDTDTATLHPGQLTPENIGHTRLPALTEKRALEVFAAGRAPQIMLDSLGQVLAESESA